MPLKYRLSHNDILPNTIYYENFIFIENDDLDTIYFMLTSDNSEYNIGSTNK